MRSLLMKWTAFLGGLYFVVYFLTPESVIDAWKLTEVHQNISYGFVVIGAVAFGVGIINLILIHGSTIVRRRQGWGYSIALLLGLFLMTTLSILDWKKDLHIASRRSNLQMLSAFSKKIEADRSSGVQTAMPFEERLGLLQRKSRELLNEIRIEISPTCDENRIPECIDAKNEIAHAIETGNQENFQKIEQSIVPIYGHQKETALSTNLFGVLNEGFFIALGSSMFALLAFYITSAAFRAFRVKSIESALLMVAAVIVMLGQTALGPQLWSGFPEFRLWLLRWPNSAAFRAISMGASVAALVMSIRLWLSIGTEGEHE